MSYAGIQIKLVDREDDTKDVGVMEDFYAQDFNTGVNARAISDVTVTGLARIISDETTDGAEAPNDTKITDGSPTS
jgi:hypothetical protein